MDPFAASADASSIRDPIALGRATPGTIGMWAFLATDAMGFGGLLMSYAVLRVRAPIWPDPGVRFDRALATALTVLLLISGATMTAAGAALRAGRRGRASALLVITAVLGTGFLLGQVAEFRALAVERHVGLAADHAASLFYVIAGYHGLHVLAGVIMLAVLATQTTRPASAPSGSLQVVSLYWQFVDLVWLVIFTVLYLIPTVSRG